MTLTIKIIKNYMKQILAFIFITALFYACKNKNYERTAETFYMPAEWEPHDAVWMGWQEDTTEFYFPVVADIIKSIAPHVRVKIAVDSDSLMQKGRLPCFNMVLIVRCILPISCPATDIGFAIMAQHFW